MNKNHQPAWWFFYARKEGTMPDERYLKEIALELRLIRKELQRKNERDAKVITNCVNVIHDGIAEKYGFEEENMES